MIQGILGKKIGMSRVFQENGNMTPVTIIQVEPAMVIQRKTLENDGYDSVQLATGEISENKKKNISKPVIGHFKQNPLKSKIKEFKVSKDDKFDIGQTIDLSIFKNGDLIDVAGTSKGRGFAGVMKRHNFSGGPASHGHRFHRTTGSIGNRKFPGRVFKNKRMPGHMGAERIKIQNISIVDIDVEKNCVVVKGSIPGANGSFVELTHAIKRSN